MTRSSNQDMAIDSVTREAAAWFARLRADDVSEADRVRFRRWLEADPRHRDAYAGFERFWSATGEYAADEEVATAVHTAEIEAEVASGETPDDAGADRPRQRRRWLPAAVAACVLAAATALLWQPLQEYRGIYATAVGEQRSIPLADGSRVMLNTDTRIRVDYGEQTRTVHLSHGQAYFRVARDVERPFLVETRNGSVRAVGTEFEVYENDGRVVVTVLEGSVAVSERADRDGNEVSGAEPPPEKILQARERVALAAGTTPETVVPLDPEPLERSVAWTSGRVVFDDEPLASAVAEINRYTRRRVVIGDERLASLHISGVFRVGDVGDFVHSLGEYFSLQVETDARGNYVLEAGERTKDAPAAATG